MNPPRPTPAKIRSLVTKTERLITDHNMMLHGNVKASDSLRLEGVRESRDNLVAARDRLRGML